MLLLSCLELYTTTLVPAASPQLGLEPGSAHNDRRLPTEEEFKCIKVSTQRCARSGVRLPLLQLTPTPVLLFPFPSVPP